MSVVVGENENCDNESFFLFVKGTGGVFLTEMSSSSIPASRVPIGEAGDTCSKHVPAHSRTYACATWSKQLAGDDGSAV